MSDGRPPLPDLPPAIPFPEPPHLTEPRCPTERPPTLPLPRERPYASEPPAGRGAELPAGLSYGWADPDEQPDDLRLWLRWPARQTCPLRVLSARPLHYPGHWSAVSRSYRLCAYPACPFCAAGMLGGGASRRMASERRMRHVLVVETAGGAQRIWEFGDAVGRQLQAITGYRRQGADETRAVALRGLSLTLCREGQRENGPTLVAAAPGRTWPEFVPEPLDAAGHLAASWRRAALRDGKGQPRLPLGF